MGPEYSELKSLVKREGLHTVCEEAGCPNIYECWEDREATFLIGGEQCTRRCDFCQIDTGKPADLDRDEPRRVAEVVQAMGLRYSTITGVARDDLPDGGAWLYAETVRADPPAQPGHRRRTAHPRLQRQVPDQLAEVFSTRPEVLAHNVETVPRIFKRIRPAFRYQRSLDVITAARDDGLVTKSNLILGMGETPEEVTAGAAATCTTPAATSSPSPSTCAPRPGTTPSSGGSSRRSSSSTRPPPRRSASPASWPDPLVRSSYRAGRLYAQAMAHHGRELPQARHTSPKAGIASQEASSLHGAARPLNRLHRRARRSTLANRAISGHGQGRILEHGELA